MKLHVLTIALIMLAAATAAADHLTILHTNDTHSSIEPDPKTGLGGVLRRKAIVDSVRAVEPNVLLVDAGDAAQGSLYFMLFRGEVERVAMNAQGYDIAILGNHEFDNGIAILADNYSKLDASLLSSNYDFTDTPLQGLFLPYSIRTAGNRRIAFIALNINPKGLIDESNVKGVVYRDALRTANDMARLLKEKEHADMVVALTHIGYENAQSDIDDVRLAAGSKDIDIIIGGHSHTMLTPGSPATKIANADGDTVLVVQTGKKGTVVGQIDIDLETLRPDYKLITVDSRLDSRADPELAAILQQYKEWVDRTASERIGQSAREMPEGSDILLNMACDIIEAKAREIPGEGDSIDFAVMNRGGLRASMPKGYVTKGDIMNIFPFDNRLTIVELKGSSVQRLLDCMASAPDVAGLSGAASARYVDGKANDIKIGGAKLDPDKTYRVATIDYLAKGNDYMTPFTEGFVSYRSFKPVFNEIIEYIETENSLGRAINAPTRLRAE